MNFTKTKDLEWVSFETNLYLTGLISIKTLEIGKYAIQCEDKCFEITKDYVSEEKDLQNEFCSNDVIRTCGKVIAFIIPENKKSSFYFCVTLQDGTPILILRRNKIKDVFCFKPRLKTLNGTIILGEVGQVTKGIYNTVETKALNISKSLPRTNYKKRIDKLLELVKNSEIPDYDTDEVNISPPKNITLSEYNKYYFSSNLNYIKDHYSKPQIYYSKVLDELEEKIYKSIGHCESIKIIS